ncbi:hypothetical protein D3C80_991020 [compost metagenome]
MQGVDAAIDDTLDTPGGADQEVEAGVDDVGNGVMCAQNVAPVEQKCQPFVELLEEHLHRREHRLGQVERFLDRVHQGFEQVGDAVDHKVKRRLYPGTDRGHYEIDHLDDALGDPGNKITDVGQPAEPPARQRTAAQGHQQPRRRIGGQIGKAHLAILNTQMPVLLRHQRQVEQARACKRIATQRNPSARPARVYIRRCRRSLAVQRACQLHAAADRLGHRVGGFLLVVLIAQQRRTTGQLGVHQLLARGDAEPVLHLGILTDLDALAGRHQRRHRHQNRRSRQRTDLLGNRQHPGAVGQQPHRPARRGVVDPTIDGQPRRLLGPYFDRRIGQWRAHFTEQRDIRAVRSEVLDLAARLHLQRRNIPVTAEGFAGELSDGVLLRLNREHRQPAVFHRGLKRLHAVVYRRRLRPAGG